MNDLAVSKKIDINSYSKIKEEIEKDQKHYHRKVEVKKGFAMTEPRVRRQVDYNSSLFLKREEQIEKRNAVAIQ